MKKEVILVPKDKCLWDVLAEMGQQGYKTESAWIFLHVNVIEKLRQSDGIQCKEWAKAETFLFERKATEKHSSVKMVVGVFEIVTDYRPVSFIVASDISYNFMPADPEHLYFFKMDE